MDDVKKILNKIQALINRAEHENTPAPEAELCRAKADELMAKYRIEEATLAATGAISLAPIFDTLTVCESQSPFTNEYYTMVYYVAASVGVRLTSGYEWSAVDEDNPTQRRVLVAYLVGMESDVRYVEAMYTALRLHAVERLEPKVKPELSDAENVYRLRSAGLERPRISQIMWGARSRERDARVTKLYLEACAARGEDPKVAGRSVSAKTYRSSFADAYVNRIVARLRQSQLVTDNALPVLASRKATVDEAFYERFPSYRPVPLTEEEKAAAFKPCPKCKAAKSGRCRAHAYRSGPARPYSSAGAAAGRSAADTADLGRTAGSNRVHGSASRAIG